MKQITCITKIAPFTMQAVVPQKITIYFEGYLFTICEWMARNTRSGVKGS